MKFLNLKNPFGAEICHEEILSSTFDAARVLAAENRPHGTVVCADFQESGRGRLKRPWAAEKGKNLLFTILLRYGDFAAVPGALTLRTGLAVALAVEELLPPAAGLVEIKWPNDIMIKDRKISGILAEGDGKNVFIGVGVNVAQREFPEEYRFRAGSLAGIFPGLGPGDDTRFALLEKILARLYGEIERPSPDWRERLFARLYKKGETVTFAEGAADSRRLFKGKISGIGPEGELLMVPEQGGEERAFTAGELRVYPGQSGRLTK